MEAKGKDWFLFNLGPEYQMEQVSRDYKVQCYNCFEGAKMFKLVFDHLFPISSRMQYWKGEVTKLREGRKDANSEFEEELLQRGLERKRSGLARKLARTFNGYDAIEVWP